jgi:cohesin complex subunit SA-1/2
MVSQATNVLSLHIMWKARAMSADAEPSVEEVKLRESVREQRDFLLEKAIEYAVGTQSNTVDGVKRAVSIKFASKLWPDANADIIFRRFTA